MAVTETIKAHMLSGPKGKPVVGSLLDFMSDPLSFLSSCRAHYGQLVPFRLANIPAMLVADPHAIEVVLRDSGTMFRQGAQQRALSALLGNGLPLSQGELWRKQRRTMQPSFNHSRVASYASIMAAYAQQALLQYNDGETRDIHDDMMQLTMRIVTKSFFDMDISSESAAISQAIAVFASHFTRRMSRITLPLSFPTPDNVSFRNRLAKVNTLIYDIIRLRREDDAPHDDLLSLLLEARDEAGLPMDDKQLHDELLTTFIAGQETTAVALSWIWMLLARNPQAEQRLHQELDTVLGERAPQLSDLPHLTYTARVIKEGMRLYPPAWTISREPIKDWTVDGYLVPGGTQLFLCQWVVHRDPELWGPDANQFRPERWTTEFEKSLPKYAYFPFGGGPRVCIGNQFALTEAALILATIASKYKFSLIPDNPPILAAGPSLRPKSGVAVVTHKR